MNKTAGVWLYNTATDGPREIVAAPVVPGLNLVALHNVLLDGSEAHERFQGQVGTIGATPTAIDLFVGNATSGSFPLSVKSSLPLVDLAAQGFGVSVPDVRKGLPQKQDNPDDPSTASYKIPLTIKNGALLDVTVASPRVTWTCSCCTISTATASSTSPMRRSPRQPPARPTSTSA